VGFYNLVAYRKEQLEPVIMTWDGNDYSVDWKGAPADGIAGRSNTEGDWDVRWRSLCVACTLIHLVDRNYEENAYGLAGHVLSAELWRVRNMR
jgi:hypothetical protein